MILDRFLTFTGAVGTSIVDSWAAGDPTESTNVIDLHMAGIPVLAADQGARDMGAADPHLAMLIQVITAFAGGTSLQIAIQGAPDDGSGAPGSYTTWWLSPAYAVADLVVGARLYDMELPRPPAGVGVPRFLRILYTNSGTFSAGELYAGIVLDRMDQMYQGLDNNVMGGYPAGITVAN